MSTISFNQNRKPRNSAPPKSASHIGARESASHIGARDNALLSGARAMIWLDMEPILLAERSKCNLAVANLERFQKNLETFQTKWQPAFSMWFHRTFGESLTRARELQSKAFELERLVSSVEEEAFYSGCSEKIAYQRLEELKLQQESGETSFNPDADDSPFRSIDDDELSPEMEHFLKKEFEQMFAGNRISKEEYAQMFEGFKASFQDDLLGKKYASEQEERYHQEEQHRGRRKASAQERKPTPETNEDKRRKQLYRELARKLHPDTNSQLSPREQELWHEVRVAYESKNIEALESLAVIVDGGGIAGYTKIKSVSGLRAIFRDLQRKLKAAQKAVREAKKDPSWDFEKVETDPARLKALTTQITHDLNDDIYDLELVVGSFERRIKRWKSVPKSRGKKHTDK